MADMMTFPDTVEEFMEEYKLVDTEQVYTNGTELVPIFRMKQWFEHEKTQLSKESTTSDLISRTATIDAVNNAFDRETLLTGFVRSIALRAIRDMPPAQPEPQEGHWIEGKIYRDIIECNCSECGQLMTTAATVRMNYCPNCGAKMTISTK